jgi:hypothetical protein
MSRVPLGLCSANLQVGILAQAVANGCRPAPPAEMPA